MVITGLTRNFWKLRPFRPLKMSAAQGFARVRISQFHIVLACFSCILPEQGLHLRYTESCPRGRRCSTRNAVCRKAPRVRIPNSPPDRGKRLLASVFLYPVSSRSSSPVGNSDKSAALWNSPLFSRLADRCTDSDTSRCA